MTKQEEIRKGIEQYTDSPSALWKYLHDNGLVIKVEGGVPDWLKFKWAKNPCMINQADIDEQFTFDIVEEAGYVKTEPLIEE